jgi:hypothetical protein
MKTEQVVFPAITLWQPWAQLIALGWKIIETRTHNRFKCLNGQTILIHAGARWDDNWFKTVAPYLDHEQEYKSDFIKKIEPTIICSVNVFNYQLLSREHSKESLIDCFPIPFKRYGLFLKDLQLFPINTFGKIDGVQGIFYYDIEKKQKVKVPKKITHQQEINY